VGKLTRRRILAIVMPAAPLAIAKPATSLPSPLLGGGRGCASGGARGRPCLLSLVCDLFILCVAVVKREEGTEEVVRLKRGTSGRKKHTIGVIGFSVSDWSSI
jgi:hypothetical protein